MTSFSFGLLLFGICFISKNASKWLTEQTLTVLLDLDLGPNPERRYTRGAAMIPSSIDDILAENILFVMASRKLVMMSP